MAKKIMKFDNPAKAYISGALETETAPQQTEHTATADNTDNTSYTSKTKNTHRSGKAAGTAKKDYRLNLLLTRELRDTLQALADFDRRSLNALINGALAAYAADREADYRAYMAFLEKTEKAREKVAYKK